MITVEKVLENLKRLISTEPMEFCNLDNEVKCAFEDFEEDGKTEVLFEKSDNSGYDFSAYINAERSTQFCFQVDKKWSEEIEDFVYSVTDVRI